MIIIHSYELWPPKHTEVLIPVPVNVILFDNRHIANGIKLRGGH